MTFPHRGQILGALYLPLDDMIMDPLLYRKRGKEQYAKYAKFWLCWLSCSITRWESANSVRMLTSILNRCEVDIML
jgi:hypothetical protein